MSLANQTRPGFGFLTSAAVQKTVKATTLSDIKPSNRAVEIAHQHAGERVVFHRGMIDLKSSADAAFGGSAFANVKQGRAHCFTNQLAQGRFDFCCSISCVSGIK